MERETEMVTWLRENFKKPQTETNDKVPVEEVREIFKRKYPKETNNTFGSIVRRAFEGVKRAKNSAGYYYSPLSFTCTSEEKKQNAEKAVEEDKCTQTSQLLESSTKERLISKVSHLQSANKALEDKAALLEKHVSLLEEKVIDVEKCNLSLKTKLEELLSKNKENKEILAKRHFTLRTNDNRGGREGQRRLKTLEVNAINEDDLVGDEFEGSYGKCKLKTFKRTGTLVIVKEMKSHDDEALFHEAKIMQSLSSDSLQFIFGVQMTKRPYSIVMQFIGDKQSTTLYQVVVGKESLFREIRKTMLKCDWIKVCHDFTEGIRHMHAMGFLHNDLKSNNVLINGKRGFLIDLGNACDATDPPARKYNNFHSHIAPEVLQGRCCSFESDVYSLGIIFNFVRKYCNVTELRDLEKDCLSNNHAMRPTASLVSCKLHELYKST